MKLELKHLAPYLPYGLKVKIMDHTALMGITSGIDVIGINRVLEVELFKPVLRPLSDFNSLQNDFDLSTDFEDAYYTGADDVAFVNTSDKTYLTDMLKVNEFIFSNHFDVFGLIPAGLAIDINTL